YGTPSHTRPVRWRDREAGPRQTDHCRAVTRRAHATTQHSRTPGARLDRGPRPFAALRDEQHAQPGLRGQPRPSRRLLPPMPGFSWAAMLSWPAILLAKSAPYQILIGCLVRVLGAVNRVLGLPALPRADAELLAQCRIACQAFDCRGKCAVVARW